MSSLKQLENKKKLISRQLKQAKISLRYHLYFGATEKCLNELPKLKDKVPGVKIYMGSSTGDLLLTERSFLERVFHICAENDILIAIHAEDESLIQLNQKKYANVLNPAIHSVIRAPYVAAKALALAIELAHKYRTRLYVTHVSSREEIALIRNGKKEGMSLYAEAAPHHLFLDEESYAILGTKALVNPPLRSKKDCDALWEALLDGTIDTIGTDHAPHTLEEKTRPLQLAPSGFPSIELYFSLLLNAFHEKKISLQQIVSLTHTRPREIFNLSENDDVVLVDLEKKRQIEDSKLKTKAKWSPYTGRILQGCPRYTVAAGVLFDLEEKSDAVS